MNQYPDDLLAFGSLVTSIPPVGKSKPCPKGAGSLRDHRSGTAGEVPASLPTPLTMVMIPPLVAQLAAGSEARGEEKDSFRWELLLTYYSLGVKYYKRSPVSGNRRWPSSR